MKAPGWKFVLLSLGALAVPLTAWAGAKEEAPHPSPLGRALDPGLVSFLSEHLTSRGDLELAQVSLPVASLDPAQERDLHQRAALHERLLSTLRDTRASSAELARLGNTAHLELFLAHALFYLEGQTREQKCLSYKRALEHARFLGWRDTAAAPGSRPLDVLQGWEELARRARAFHDAGFSSRIPARLCELRPAESKSEVESKLKSSIDGRIRARVQAEIDATRGTLESKRKQYADALAQSEVPVPTQELFALQRIVKDSGSLLQQVRDDALMLEHAPDPKPPLAPQVPLMEQLRQKQKEVQDLQRQGGEGRAGDELNKARGLLGEHQAMLASLVGVLQDIAATPGLDRALRERLRACTQLPDPVTPTFVTSLDRCLQQIALVHGQLKQRQGATPDQTRFVEKVADLSRNYIGFVNSLPSGNQVQP